MGVTTYDALPIFVVGCNVMAGTMSILKGFLADLPTPFLPNIGGEPTREGLIKLHRLVSGNAASVSSNFLGGRNGHLALTMTSKEYAPQTGFEFMLPNNPGN